MDQYEYVRTAYRVYGKSIHTIERETGHDRKTIRKVLKVSTVDIAKERLNPIRLWGRILRPSTPGLKQTRLPRKTSAIPQQGFFTG